MKRPGPANRPRPQDGPLTPTSLLDTTRHRIGDPEYAAQCRAELDRTGALVLGSFFANDAIDQIVEESSGREDEAFFAGSTHNVYLTPNDPSLPASHPLNRQIVSTKGLIADDQIPAESPLRTIYNDGSFRTFLCNVLDIDLIHSYADDLSSINIHFAGEGMELGWHFDNSSFAVTVLLQAAEGGAEFQYVPAVRNSETGEEAVDRVSRVLDNREQAQSLHFEPGDLVLFRGRDALHRVTPTEGDITRMLVVFAFNDQPNVALSDSALLTFYGRTS